MGRSNAETDGITLGHLFEFATGELTCEMDKDLIKDFAIGDCSKLRPREKEVLKCRYWSGMTLKATGDQLGISPEITRQIENKSLRKLTIYILRADPVLAEEQKSLIEQREKDKKQAKLEYQAEWEKNLPCPDYLLLKRGINDELQLELPIEYSGQFNPILSSTYKRWLKEKSECPIALKELEDSEMEPRDT